MGLNDIIAGAVATAKAAVADLLVDVQQVPQTGRDVHGPTYGDPIPREALVEDVGEAVVEEGGTTTLATSKLTFLEPIAVSMEDLFVVNGAELQVGKRAGLLRPQGDMSYYSEVYVGRRTR